ncbi:hypothetical protein [Paraburkholderia silvatlantica]|uniref:Uncharacterized protein n=1 Tax=Paraburkholderia silvatlantica TaxID=321895 RepID=A0ABR6FV13_9BURK|nr:hypothetical protein [Paraburkholderia silvatlantica]MBB2931267.1 hypothetical protein [Paraburkholderia silvatlantica]
MTSRRTWGYEPPYTLANVAKDKIDGSEKIGKVIVFEYLCAYEVGETVFAREQRGILSAALKFETHPVGQVRHQARQYRYARRAPYDFTRPEHWRATAGDQGRFALTVRASGSATSTMGTNSAEPVRVDFPESMYMGRLRSCMIHLRSWAAFMPALSARSTTDAPGFSHASISHRLPWGSKQRRPPSSMCVT